MFLGCNCIYKHFVDIKKKHCVQIFKTFIVFFVNKTKTTVHEFEQNQCHDIIRSSAMNMLFITGIKGYYFPRFIIR